MPRILVIDDLAPVRATWRDMLEEAGHEVLEARNGEEGLASLAREQIDLVLTDIFMPEKDGIETIGEIRRLCPEVKIIAISGYADNSASPYLRIAQHLGADATLCKPIDPDVLMSAVTQTLGQATGRRVCE